MKSSLHRISILRIALDVPQAISARAALVPAGEAASAGAVGAPGDALFDYRWHASAEPGQRAIVPWGRQSVIGLIVQVSDVSALEPARLRDALAVLGDVPPLLPGWFDLMRFAARYYQRSIGEVALPALPALLRRPGAYRVDPEAGPSSRSMAALLKRLERLVGTRATPLVDAPLIPELTGEQKLAVDAVSACMDQSAAPEARTTPSVFLLHGITGSGKTEIYLRLIAKAIANHRQVLVLVPEINLTPQLERLFRERFARALVATLHSAMADGERVLHWLAAHRGEADILLGTRMAVLASLPRLGLIIVDEEHDPSFKQQEGLRYSARDLAVMRAAQLQIPAILGSATPSFESWLQVARNRYALLTLTGRAVANAVLPEIRLLEVQREPLEHGFSATLRAALAERLERREQALVFLNRRGYAPVLCCSACGWISDCRRCSAHMVFHKSDGALHCHHCGWQVPVPRACPDCGNLDLAPLGRGTQRVEEALRDWFPDARIARIDRDSTRRKGSAQQLLGAVHAGQVDLLVGTQMVAKGHDFQNLTLVGIVDADSALFSQDFRAPERLFANLMQVAGRAGRADKPGLVLIQTRFPRHPLFTALARHDYASFATTQLAERESAGLPPYSYQAILRAEARSLSIALEFLASARALATSIPQADGVEVYDAVPMPLVRLANVERAQLMVESSSRPALQGFLPAWIGALRGLKARANWHVEVDPLEI